MQGVAITTITPANPSDERGAVYELFKGLSGQQVTVFTRNSGAVFGNHFHKGLDPSKDPEYFFLIQGEMTLSFYDGRTGQREIVPLVGGQLLTLEKGIYHSFEAMTDVIYIEHRKTIFDPAHSDCFLLGEYEAYIETLKKSP